MTQAYSKKKKWSLLGVKPPTPKISLVILLTVYYIIPMILVQRIWYFSLFSSLACLILYNNIVREMLSWSPMVVKGLRRSKQSTILAYLREKWASSGEIDLHYFPGLKSWLCRKFWEVSLEEPIWASYPFLGLLHHRNPRNG